MAWQKDITGVDLKKKGSFRSLNGAADENIFIGKACKAGYFCFFKAWRDMPYDAIIDHESNLLRVEVKGSSNNKFDVTRGTRSGKQIIRGNTNPRIISREDCDFVVGVDSNNGDCYIIPVDVVEIVNRKNLSTKILQAYKEKWALFMPSKTKLSKEQIRDGIRKLNSTQRNNLFTSCNIQKPTIPLKVSRTNTINNRADAEVFQIWTEIANSL